MQKEIVIKVDPKPLPGWACPNCQGCGNLGDGSASYSTTEVRLRPATPCPVCEGSGRVEVRPVREGGAS